MSNNLWDNELFLKNKVISNISKEDIEKPIVTIREFLNKHSKYKNLDLYKGISIKKKTYSKTQKLNPSIQIAKPEEAKDISEIIKQAYNGTYPYKEMESELEVRKMIENPAFYWLVFKVNNNHIIGCIGFDINLKTKSAAFHGLAIKKEFQGITALFELLLAGYYSILNKYEKKILSWSCEIRSAHNKTQFLSIFIDLFPIAFFPKKDIFFNREESEFLFIIYDSDALYKYRSKEKPKIIYQILNCYAYSAKKLQIGLPQTKKYKKLNFNKKEINYIKNNLVVKAESDSIGNEKFTIYIKNRDSNITFLHNPISKIFEKTEYQVSNKEELLIFVQKIKQLIKNYNIRYFECFVSAYHPSHQTILFDANLTPFGYIPSFKYNEKNGVFEDQIVFVYYEGKVNNHLKLIPETEDFLRTIRPLWDF